LEIHPLPDKFLNRADRTSAKPLIPYNFSALHVNP
jgi:hypothetical protein